MRAIAAYSATIVSVMTSPTMPLSQKDDLDGRKGPYVSFSSGSASPPESSSEHDEFEERVLDAIKSDTFLVDWIGPGDKGNPQNLPYWRKWLITMYVMLE